MREQEILSLLADGKRHEEIASARYISVPTVRFHIKNIYHKLGAHNKVSALQAAHQLCIDDGNIQSCVVEQLCHRRMVISCGLHDHASLTVQAFELPCQFAQFTVGVTDFKG